MDCGQNELSSLFQWINYNPDTWSYFTNNFTKSTFRKQHISIITKLVEDSQYTLAVVAILACRDDYPSIQSIRKWSIIKAQEEIECKGIKKAMGDYIKLLKYEQLYPSNDLPIKDDEEEL